ncbi:hypothetical protein L873DRAFT_1792603 [Choiromyces venosus 120613-1]|uniref:Uncharacterized protein n=1 Tax=Choiromyces venosus 120613-1 TaxID=1336337 RepID=A0A3N4JE97_9PEZI|nr:hypothetical protein L873DRAFT_1792603 [Choiromyces venosus 120613-1]
MIQMDRQVKIPYRGPLVDIVNTSASLILYAEVQYRYSPIKKHSASSHLFHSLYPDILYGPQVYTGPCENPLNTFPTNIKQRVHFNKRQSSTATNTSISKITILHSFSIQYKRTKPGSRPTLRKRGKKEGKKKTQIPQDSLTITPVINQPAKPSCPNNNNRQSSTQAQAQRRETIPSFNPGIPISYNSIEADYLYPSLAPPRIPINRISRNISQLCEYRSKYTGGGGVEVDRLPYQEKNEELLQEDEEEEATARCDE